MLNCQSINQLSSTGLRPHSIIVFEFLMLYNNNRKRENEYQKVIIDHLFDMGVSALGFYEGYYWMMMLWTSIDHR
jgi:hypothetical protein